MGKYKIVIKDSIKNKVIFKEVNAEKIIIKGIECFIFKETFGYNISHISSGCQMVSNEPNKRRAIKCVSERLKKYPDWENLIINRLKDFGVSYPIQ